MKKNTIKIGGREYTIGMDFSVMLAFEELHGKQLDMDKLNTITEQVRLIYAVLNAFNDDFTMSFKEFTHTLKPSELKEMGNNMEKMFTKFFAIPSIAESHVEGDSNDDEEKN